MKKVRSLYHKPLGERGFGRYIVGWTWMLGLFYNWKVLKYNFSHEELWFPDENGEFTTTSQISNPCPAGNRNCLVNHFSYKQTPKGTCFSSTTRGDANGVRFAPASEVVGKHPDRWDYIEFEVEGWAYDQLLWRAQCHVGKEYDFVGVGLGFTSPVNIQDNNKWYCSEICCWLKYRAGVLAKRYKRISPRRSAMIMAKKYGEPKGVAE